MERYEKPALPEEDMGSMESNTGGLQKTSWAIICPGPSLRTKEWDYIFDEGCLVAVNGAVKLITPDYWAMVDEEVFNSVIETMRVPQIPVLLRDTVLWVPEKWTYRADHGRLLSIFYKFNKETWVDLTREMNDLLDPHLKDLIAVNGYPLSWNNTTMFQAIALAIKKGAQYIRIYGADLTGKGYCTPGMENKRTVHTDERWTVEKFWLDKIIESCSRHNITIERMAATHA